MLEKNEDCCKVFFFVLVEIPKSRLRDEALHEVIY